MKILPTAAAAGLLAVAVPSLPSAQPAAPRDRLIVNVAWLAEHLNDRGLVILQVGRQATYDAGHIPGARFVNYDSGALRAPMDGSGATDQLILEMPAPQALRDELAALGISDNSRIVVAASDGYMSPSTRVVATLEYAGLRHVSWLDGGVKAWTEAGRTLSTNVPPVKTGTLRPLAIRPVVVDAAFVNAHIRKKGFAIVDARTRNFYDGVPPQRSSGAPGAKLGHIPGAVSAPYSDFATSESGGTKLKSADEIAAMFAAAGVKPGDTVITYCHIGQQATTVLLAARTAGFNALLYDGSFTDWQKRDLPVENPSAKKHD